LFVGVCVKLLSMSMCLSMDNPVHNFLSLSLAHSLCLSLSLSVCVCVCVSFCLSPSVCPSLPLPISISVLLSPATPIPLSLSVTMNATCHQLQIGYHSLSAHARADIHSCPVMQSTKAGPSREEIKRQVHAMVQSVAEGPIGPDQDLIQHGVDPLTASRKLQRLISAKYGVEMPPGLLWQFPTADSIAIFVSHRLRAANKVRCKVLAQGLDLP
jgi:hypothetical protein